MRFIARLIVFVAELAFFAFVAHWLAFPGNAIADIALVSVLYTVITMIAWIVFAILFAINAVIGCILLPVVLVAMGAIVLEAIAHITPDHLVITNNSFWNVLLIGLVLAFVNFPGADVNDEKRN